MVNTTQDIYLTADDALTLAVDLCDISLPHAWSSRRFRSLLMHCLQNRWTILLTTGDLLCYVSNSLLERLSAIDVTFETRANIVEDDSRARTHTDMGSIFDRYRHVRPLSISV